jgi:hypothetical protein
MTYDRIDGLPDDSDETRSLPGQSISGEPVERPIRGGEVLRQERLGDGPIQSVMLSALFQQAGSNSAVDFRAFCPRSCSLRPRSAKTYEHPARRTACRNTDEFPVAESTYRAALYGARRGVQLGRPMKPSWLPPLVRLSSARRTTRWPASGPAHGPSCRCRSA